MHSNSQLLFWKYAKAFPGAFNQGHRVLEIGPDKFPSTFHALTHSSHPDMPPKKGEPWDTIDIYESPKLTYRATDPYVYPIPSDTYDLVLSGNVMEHIPAPWTWIQEVARLTKPGGLVITILPVSWPFHEYPKDCWRAYPDGMKALYAHAGLEVLISVCESLEAKRYPRSVAGRTPGWWIKGWRKYAYRAFGRLGGRVECAYDTITIGRKPTT